MDAEIYKGFIKDEMDVPGGSIIIQEGRPSKWTFLIIKGRVKVKSRTAASLVTLDTLGEGAIVGEMALFEDSEPLGSATVMADGPVRLAVLDREAVRGRFRQLSPQLQETIRALIRRLREATDEVKALAGKVS